MIVTVFRNRLRPEHQPEYSAMITTISALARGMPGYISHKTFTAEDGERVTIVEFESEQAQRAWATHPDHVNAMKQGRALFYQDYRLQICELLRESSMGQGRHPG